MNRAKGKFSRFNPKAQTLYLLISSRLATDSAFPFSLNEVVDVTIKDNALVVTKVEAPSK